MKILHIITSLRTGGAERLVVDLLPRLQRNGHHVELLLFDGTRTTLYEQAQQRNITIHALGHGALQMRNPLHLFRLKKYLKKERFDIVHTHNTPCQLLAAMAAAEDAPVLVTTEHNTFNRRRNWRWYDAVDRRMYGKYSHIICVGEQTARNLAEKLGSGADMTKISVVYNGIDVSQFCNAAPAASLRTPDEADRKVVVMVSAFRPQKDQPTLIRAMLHLPDSYRLWLVGDGALRASCEKLAEELKISSKVRFWGERSDVARILASADAVVLSSHYEGMSLSSIEGMASGRPFVASDVEGLRETAGGAGVLVPCGDDRAMAAAIVGLCEDSLHRAEVVARCRERAARYDIESTVSGYERIYEKLVKQRYEI